MIRPAVAANKRLSILRAMFNSLAKQGKIKRADVPAFPMAEGVDNTRRGFLEKEDLPKLLQALPKDLRAVVRPRGSVQKRPTGVRSKPANGSGPELLEVVPDHGLR